MSPQRDTFGIIVYFDSTLSPSNIGHNEAWPTLLETVCQYKRSVFVRCSFSLRWIAAVCLDNCEESCGQKRTLSKLSVVCNLAICCLKGPLLEHMFCFLQHLRIDEHRSTEATRIFPYIISHCAGARLGRQQYSQNVNPWNGASGNVCL